MRAPSTPVRGILLGVHVHDENGETRSRRGRGEAAGYHCLSGSALVDRYGDCLHADMRLATCATVHKCREAQMQRGNPAPIRAGWSIAWLQQGRAARVRI